MIPNTITYDHIKHNKMQEAIPYDHIKHYMIEEAIKVFSAFSCILQTVPPETNIGMCTPNSPLWDLTEECVLQPVPLGLRQMLP